MNDIELAWAAGFWDGEGCVSHSVRGKYQYPRSVLQVAQIHREPLERFQKALGFGSILGPYPKKTPTSQDYYVWRVEGNTHLERFKLLLWESLCSIKQDQIQRSLDARDAWEKEALCPVHKIRLTKPTTMWRCDECQSEQGRKNALARWGDRSQRHSKICSRCKKSRAMDCFSAQRKAKDGRQSICKDCMKEYRKAR